MLDIFSYLDYMESQWNHGYPEPEEQEPEPEQEQKAFQQPNYYDEY